MDMMMDLTVTPATRNFIDQEYEVTYCETELFRHRNSVLRNLSAESIQRLKLTHTELPVSRPLERCDREIGHIYFIESGVASMTTPFQDGTEMEVGLFGYESAIGVSAFMGVRRSLNRIYMQMPGTGFTSRIADAQAEFDLGGEFQRLALRCVQMQLTQATQSAACNARHDLEQRLARWLLLCSDRTGTIDLTFSQALLSRMLGVRRPSIAVAMGQLKRRGLVDYLRGKIRLLDIPGLQTQACECYHVVKGHLGSDLDFDAGFTI